MASVIFSSVKACPVTFTDFLGLGGAGRGAGCFLLGGGLIDYWFWFHTTS